MVGIVLVSHSRKLAQAAVELALQMVHGTPPPIEIAAGLDGGVLGTDAVCVMEAIDRVASPDGVLVLMDLGSAVLSAELALDLRSNADGCPVVLSDAPLVEGLVAAVVLSAAGASLAEVAADARGAADIKVKLLGGPGPASPAPGDDDAWEGFTVELVLRNDHGLHARPAALLVETVRRFEADVSVANLTTGGAPVSARSVSALSTLGALSGHRIEVEARGRQAREALAATSALVGRNFHEHAPAAPPTPAPAPSGPLPAAPGIGVGPKCSLLGVLRETNSDRAPLTVEAEHDRLAAAVARARGDVTTLRGRVAATVGGHEAAIFDAHLLLLEDDELVGRAQAFLAAGGVSAGQAWTSAVDALAGRFAALGDPYLRARAGDVRGVGDQVLDHLRGESRGEAATPSGVVVAPDLSPAQAARLDPALVDGIVLAFGSPLSHGAILARSLGIPAVVAAGEDVLAIPDGSIMVVDGTTGCVAVDPAADVLAAYRARAEVQRRGAQVLAAAAVQPAVTLDGTTVEVAANVGSADDAALAVANGADSVGLLRTEFLFVDRRQAPDEEEQLAAYQSVADALGGRRLTVRTLDAGGDKPIPYLPATTTWTSALGSRGIRLSLQQPEMFKVQLRALVRLGMRHPVTVLFPMLATVAELRTARRLLEDAAIEVGCPAGMLPEGFEVGAMVEVPAFALLAQQAAGLVDVFSVGTNDLTQYTMAADRGDPAVAHLADPLHPAVLRLIAGVIASAEPGVRVAVCGEIAGDPAVTELLVGLGVGELSMSSPAIPAVKVAVRSFSLAAAGELARLALRQSSGAEVRALLTAPTTG